MSEAVRMEFVSVHIGGLALLDRVSIQVLPGEIVGLVGPNGAGKTTLANVLCGIRRRHDGNVWLLDRNVTRWPPHRRAKRGLARTFQDARPIRQLNNLHNAAVGAAFNAPMSLRAAERVADAALLEVGLGKYRRRDAESMSSGQQKLLDFARAIASKPRVMMLDEPLAALSDSNQDLVLDLIRAQADNGTAVVLVEHVMKAVMDIADKIIVLASGRVLAQGSPAKVAEDQAVIDAYLRPMGAQIVERTNGQ